MPRTGGVRVAQPSALASARAGGVDAKFAQFEDVAASTLPQCEKTPDPLHSACIGRDCEQKYLLGSSSIHQNMVHLKLELGNICRLVDSTMRDLQNGIIAELQSVEAHIEALHANATCVQAAGAALHHTPENVLHASDQLDSDPQQCNMMEPSLPDVRSPLTSGLNLDTQQVVGNGADGTFRGGMNCGFSIESKENTGDVQSYVASEPTDSPCGCSLQGNKQGEEEKEEKHIIAAHDTLSQAPSSPPPPCASPCPQGPAPKSRKSAVRNTSTSHDETRPRESQLNQTRVSIKSSVVSQKHIIDYHAREWNRKSGGTFAEAEMRRKKLRVNMQMQKGVSPMMAMIRHEADIAEDEDEEVDEGTPTPSRWKRLRRRIDIFLSYYAFDAAMGLVILLNAFTIGVSTSHSVKSLPDPDYLKVMEKCFVAVFTIELTLRFIAYGPRVLRSHWVKFDCFLVFIGLFSLVIESSQIRPDLASKAVLIRFFRLIRLARALRLLVQFQTLWLLVQGLLYSAMPLFWTMVLILVFLYVFAVVGMELVSQDPSGSKSKDYRDAAGNFSDLGKAGMTLMQFLTLDSVGQIYRPLITANPYLAIYFMAFFLVASMALVNLVTALMVESSSRQAREDREMQRAMQQSMKAALIPELRAMFEQLDVDHSGELQLCELLNAHYSVHNYLQHFLEVENIKDLFMLLDYDGSGSVAIDEFCEGIMQAQGQKPMELLRVMKQTQEILFNSRRVMRLLSSATGIEVQPFQSYPRTSEPIGTCTGPKNHATLLD